MRQSVRPVRTTLLAVLALAAAGALAACGGGGGGSGSPPPPPGPPPPPTVATSPDITRKKSEGATLVADLRNATCFDVPSACWVQRSGAEAVFDYNGVQRGGYSYCGALAPGSNVPSVGVQLPASSVTQHLTFRYEYSCPRTVAGPSESAVSRDVTIDVVPEASTFNPVAFIYNYVFGGSLDEVRSTTITSAGQGVPVNVSTIPVAAGATPAAGFATVNASDIPNYTLTLTAAQLAALKARQDAPGTFRTGSPIVAEGASIVFGQDIGYTRSCPNGASGWLPAGKGGCPVSTPVAYNIPLLAQPATGICRATGPETIGVYSNGVLMRGPSGEGSYQNAGVWHEYISAFASSGFDLCDGHADAAGGAYHHHGYSNCLAIQVGDEPTLHRSGHSPIYGYAADGYPVYGPWFSDGDTAQSCWKKRDYSAASPTGCGVDGARTCKMVNPEDINSGTVPIASPGPSTTAMGSADSGHTIPLVSGVFVEDYVFDPACPAQGPQYLDKHNGHDHDGLGYHYHLTVDGSFQPAFPNGPGPTFAGELKSGGALSCVP